MWLFSLSSSLNKLPNKKKALPQIFAIDVHGSTNAVKAWMPMNYHGIGAYRSS
jgi:hypothetical protein